MRLSEVEIGVVYWTRIGDERARVKVLDRVDTAKGPTRLRVARVESDGSTGKPLPKARTAAALHMS